MASYRLSRDADEDLTNLVSFSVERFGTAQARRYHAELLECFALISAMPRLGRRASKGITEVRRHEHRSHVIFYEIAESGILILAIVHQRSLRRVPR